MTNINYIEKFIKQAKAKGQMEVKIKWAKSLLTDGLSVSEIAQKTELSSDKVKELKKNL